MAVFSRLPLELWLQILSHLDYLDLKRCQRVNYLFRDITLSRPFDKAMFRLRASSEPSTRTPPTLMTAHPALDEICVAIGLCSVVDGVPILFDNMERFSDDLSTREAATYPPSRHLHVVYGNNVVQGRLCLRRGNGVAVGVGRCGHGAHVGAGVCGLLESMYQPIEAGNDDDDGTITLANLVAALHWQVHDGAVRILRHTALKEQRRRLLISRVVSGGEEGDDFDYDYQVADHDDDERDVDDVDIMPFDLVALTEFITDKPWPAQVTPCLRCTTCPAPRYPHRYVSSTSTLPSRTTPMVENGISYSLLNVRSLDVDSHEDVQGGDEE